MRGVVLRANGNRISRYSMKAMLLASAAFCLAHAIGAPGPTFAQSAKPQTITLNIRSQDLGSALTVLADRAGMRLLFPSGIVTGLTSPKLSGDFTREQALARLLAGSGLDYSFTDANTVTITNPATESYAARVARDDPVLLDPIVVKAGRDGEAADTPYQTAGSSSYISGEQIERFRGTSPADMLRAVPGVTTSGTRNGGAINVNVRGMQDMDRVPVVVDGALQSITEYRGYAGAANRSYVDPDFIGGISVERGPSLGADASGATGGVVRMNTIRAEDIVQEGKNWGIRLRGGLNSNSVSPPQPGTFGGMILNRIPGSARPLPALETIDFFTPGNFERPELLNPSTGSGSIVAAYSDDLFEFVAAHAQRYQGNYFAGRNGDDGAGLLIEPHSSAPNQYVASNTGIGPYRLGEEVLNTSNDSKSWLAKAAVKLDGGHRIEASYIRYDSEYGELMPSYFSLFPLGVPQMPLSDVAVDTYTATWTWNPDDNDLINLRMNAWRTEVDQTIRVAVDSSALVEYPREGDRWGISAENTSMLATRLGEVSFNYGLSYNDAAIDSRTIQSLNGSIVSEMPDRQGWRREASAFASSQYKPTHWLKFDAGGRYTHTTSHDDCASGRNCYDDLKTDGWAPIAAVTVEPWRGIQGYVRYAEAIRSPSLYEAIQGTSFSELPTRPLLPEHAKNWEVGVNILRDDTFTDGDKLRFKAAWFDNTIDDYLTRRAIRGSRYVMTNLESAWFKGIELSASYDTGTVFGDIAYNRYLDSEFCLSDEDFPIPGAPNATQCSSGGTNAGFNAMHVPPKEKLSVTLGTRAFDERLTLGGRATYVGQRLSESNGTGRLITPNWNPYTIVDLFASYKINDRMQLDLNIDNVGDRFYIDALEDGFNPGPGRTLRGTLTVNF